MNFWQAVDDELKYSGMTRKELSQKVGFPDSYIPKGIARNSVPAADLALRIAHALNVPLEELLAIPHDDSAQDFPCTAEKLHLYRKYHAHITALESLPTHQKELIFSLAEELSKAKP